MYLASIADLRGQLGFDDMTDINTAIGDALDAAETQVAAILRTDFDKVNVTDTFYIDNTERRGGAVKTELLLSRGFLTASPSQVITQQQAPIFLTAFDEVQANYGGTGGPLPNFVFNLEKGFGIDTTNFYLKTYIQISYTSGFDPDGTTSAQYNLTQVPGWLQQGAKLMALLLLADSAPVTEAGITINTKMVEQQARLLLQKKIRYKPVALDPISEPVYS